LVAGKMVDAGKVVRLSGQKPIITAGLVACTRGIDNLENRLQTVRFGRLPKDGLPAWQSNPTGN
jgi:hypothetical protein